MGCAARQQDMGEAAGRGADVEGLFSGRIDGEVVERRRELDAAARNPRIGRAGVSCGGKRHRFGRLGDDADRRA